MDKSVPFTDSGNVGAGSGSSLEAFLSVSCKGGVNEDKSVHSTGAPVLTEKTEYQTLD